MRVGVVVVVVVVVYVGDTTKLQSDVALQAALKWREICFLVRQNYAGKYSRSEANYFVLLKKKFID